jgi:ketosteroid isomerase-like protein
MTVVYRSVRRKISGNGAVGMSQDAISQVRTAQREWIRAIQEKNTSRLLDMVTKDILVIHPNGKIVRGVDELHADFKRFF